MRFSLKYLRRISTSNSSRFVGWSLCEADEVSRDRGLRLHLCGQPESSATVGCVEEFSLCAQRLFAV